MENAFFGDLENIAEDQLKRDTEELTKELKQWSLGYGIAKEKQINPIAMTLAPLKELIEIEDLVTVGKQILWKNACKTFFAGAAIDLDAFESRMDQYRNLILGNGENGYAIDELGLLLVEIREDLDRKPLFSFKKFFWANKVEALCRSLFTTHLYNYEYKMERSLPDKAAYLENGGIGTGFSLTVLTLRILAGENFKQTPFSENTIVWASRALCLFNDLITFEKELKEKHINHVLLSLSELTGTMTGKLVLMKCALKETTDKALYYADLARRGIFELQSESLIMSKIIRNMLDFAYAAYVRQKKDYHAFSLDELSLLLRETAGDI